MESIRGLQPLKSSIKPEPIKAQDENSSNTIRLVFGTMEKDGTVREPTPEEQAEYESYCN